jgi:acetyl esterase/lipase
MSRTALLFLAAAAALSPNLMSQASRWPPGPEHLTLPVWPGVAPGERANPPAEKNLTTTKGRLVAGRPLIRLTNVSTPTITVYSPKARNTGVAVVVFPGGGYGILAIDLEGTEACNWLNSIGTTCILLKYRGPASGPYPKRAAALQDAQRAMGLVRLHAAEWGIDPNRLGVLGFSAGGHLSAALSNNYEKRLYPPQDAADKLSCRPDFAVLVYPGRLTQPDHNYALSPGIQPTANTPPTFIVQAEDDPVHVENAVVYFMALKNAKVPAELHVYAQGGHGFGLRRTALPITTWPQAVETWLHTIKVLSAE